MTINEAIEKMQATVETSKERLDGNGFTMSIETEYLNSMLGGVNDLKKAKYVTVSLIISAEDTAEGDEYCMSLGADIRSKNVNNEQLEKDIESYQKMVDEAAEALSEYENKNEGLAHLTAKANEEYEKLLAKIEEEQKKSRKMSMIINIAFIACIALLFIFALLK